MDSLGTLCTSFCVMGVFVMMLLAGISRLRAGDNTVQPWQMPDYVRRRGKTARVAVVPLRPVADSSFIRNYADLRSTPELRAGVVAEAEQHGDSPAAAE